ncbi:MAG: nitrate/nitrite transporter NrtS [Leptospiraceae bacterium]|nr:nitrate/nitrite transporter NrtS [Leptospiraceae bacterium]
MPNNRLIIARGLKTSMLVGTILVLINNYELFVLGKWGSFPIFKVALTYLVPFLVSTYSSYAIIKSLKKDSSNENKELD